MFQYTQKTLGLLLGFSLLTACQGKNPFDRSNDPTKDYSNIEQTSDDYKQLENTALEQYRVEAQKEINRLKYENQELKNKNQLSELQKKNSQSSCGRIYDMTIKGTEGGRMDFIENTEKTYHIQVRSYLSNQFSLKLEKAPDSSMKLVPTDKKDEWAIIWKPSSSLISEKESFFTGPLKIAFIPQASSAEAQKCLTGQYTEDYSVTVALDAAQPVLTVEDLSKKDFQSKEGSALVKVTVSDPTATNNLPPQVFPVSVQNTSQSDVTPLVAGCLDLKATGTANTWTADCVVFFNPLKDKVDAAKNGDTLQGVVAFRAVSQRTGRRTPVVPKNLKITVNEPSKVLPPIEPNLTRYENGEVPVPTPRPERALPKVDPDQSESTGEIPIPTPRPSRENQ